MAKKDPFRDAEKHTKCPKCGDMFAWNKEDGLAGQKCSCGYEFPVKKPQQLPKEVLNALQSARIAFFELADEAGDVPTWNRGGQAYKASQSVKRMLEKYGPDANLQVLQQKGKIDEESCNECGEKIPDCPGGTTENKHHAKSCSLYDAEKE